LGFILAGNTAGAAVAYCTSLLATEAYVLPATIPYALAIIAQGGRFHYAMASLVVSFILLLTVLARRLNKSITESITLHFVNEDLLNNLRNTQSKITQTAKMVALGEMSGGVAHEINTPLGVIQLENDGLRKLCQTHAITAERVSASVERTAAMVSRISRIVNGLRTFARENAGEAPADVTVRELVDAAADLCSGRMSSRGVTFEINQIPEGLKVRCHSNKIIQALLNLLNNALEAAETVTGGKVQLDVTDVNGLAKIAVSDNGRGVPKNIREKIMQPFFTTKKIGEGTGLGLSVALGIVNSYGGTIDYETSDRGSIFVIGLPKSTEQKTA